MDNVFIERLWRSLKHEDIYLRGYAGCGEVRAVIAACMEFSIPAAFTRRSAIKRRWRSGATPRPKAKAVDMMDNAVALITQPKQQTQLLAA